MRAISNIFWLGTKELRSFMRDYVLLGAGHLLLLARHHRAGAEQFAGVHNASIAFVDEDHSELSRRIVHAFLPPYFQTPQPIAERDIVPLMNAGRYTFVIDIPPNFERVRPRRPPCPRYRSMSMRPRWCRPVSARIIPQQIIMTEIAGLSLARARARRCRRSTSMCASPLIPNITPLGSPASWASSTTSPCSAIILAGAAIVREREHGTMDHLLVMPLTPFEIAMSKVWANGLVITVAAGLSLYLVVRTFLGMFPSLGSIPLFMLGVMIYLFFACAIGIFLGTIARTMPQLGLLFMLVFLPMNMLSGSNTPLESMPPWLANAMQASPSTHFVSFAQAILYRGAGIDVVWPQFAFVAGVGGVFFLLAILRFRATAAQAM